MIIRNKHIIWKCALLFTFLYLFIKIFIRNNPILFHQERLCAEQEMLIKELSEAINENAMKLNEFKKAVEFNLLLASMNNQSSFIDQLDLQLPSIKNYLPHINDDYYKLLPYIKISRNRTNASIVIGIPTTPRERENYLLWTLNSLISAMNEVEKLRCLVVVLICQPLDAMKIDALVKQITDRFGAEIDSGLLEIIVPPYSFYPDFNDFDATLNDSYERFRWRLKQVYDFAYLMMYSVKRGKYYLQLEDDVFSADGFFAHITQHIGSLKGSWIILDYCSLGFIDKPIDWLLSSFVDMQKSTTVMKQLAWRVYKPALFQHTGHFSSLKHKIQKLSIGEFHPNVRTRAKHVNPPATCITSLKHYGRYDLGSAYRNGELFWAYEPTPGDSITFKFNTPTRLTSILFNSGAPERYSDRAYSASVTACKYSDNEYGTQNNSNCDMICVFDNETGSARAFFNDSRNPVLSISINFHVKSSYWFALNKIQFTVAFP